MSLKAADLVAALADLEGDEESARQDTLPEALLDLSRHPAPEGALPRLWAFGGLQARVALAYLAYWVQSWFLDADRRERELAEVHLRAAIKMLRTMGYLRGAVMKLGQALANLPDIVHEDDPIEVPRVHDELSTRRVLTMEYLGGIHIHAFLAGNPPHERRDHFGGLIVQAGARLHFAGRLLYAEPHPGNYLFRADGHLGLLDFGCVRPYTDREWECNRLADLAIRGGDDDVVRALRASLGMAEDEAFDPEILARNVAFSRWLWRPYRHDGPFDFGDPGYLREGVGHVAALGRARIPSPWLTMNAFIERWYFGMIAMLYRLRARVDVRAIYLRERRTLSGG